MTIDLKLVGGQVVDGTGAPPRRADVGVTGGRIVSVGVVPDTARETVDASDLVVAPGFIDIHTHYDAQVLWDRMLSVSPWHGVTTAILGNCGFGVAPVARAHRDLLLETLEKVEGMSLASLKAGIGEEWPFESFPQYLDVLSARGTAIHVASYVGHTTVRLHVLGDEAAERTASPEEIGRMRAIVREAMDAGAIGFATSKSLTHLGFRGKPVPSRLADDAEISALTDVLREVGRGVLQVTIGPGLLPHEVAELAARIGRPATWSALLTGLMGPGSHRMFLDENARQVARGVRLAPQASCRPLSFEFHFGEPYPFEALPFVGRLASAGPDERRRAYRDPSFRSELRQAVGADSMGPFAHAFERMVVSYSPTDPSLEEQCVADVARRQGIDPVDFALDLSLATEERARFRFAALNYDEAELTEILQDPNVILGLSDAGAHASQLCDACFSTHLLGHWVREKGALPLERAVHMMTALPADFFGLEDRGRIRVGAVADLVLLDPRTVGAGPLRRVHDQPERGERLVADASGIEAVFVAGACLRRGGKDLLDPTGPLPGRLIRSGRAREGA